MKFISARLKGLQGLYRNSMQKEIFIDFRKCKHNIIYIVGPNGSGKTTIISVLHPLPDPSTMYLDRELGEKELVYECNGTLYNILIQYPVYGNGTRANTKAFIREINSDGQMVELNENGTVGSFKEIVYSRFNLDPNFVSLSYLSVEDRGIVEKKPSDRKKFVSNLLEAVEVYNDIYKTLVKRSSVFKSMINSITAKIDSVGNYDKLMMDKVATDNRLNVLEDQKSTLEQQIAASRASINLIDPDNAIRTLYKELVEKYNILKSNLDLLYESVQAYDMNDIDEATSSYLELKQKESSLLDEISFIKNKINDTLASREEESRLIFIKTQKYNGLISGIKSDDLNKLIRDYRKKIFEYDKIFTKIGIKPGEITKDEYIIGLNTLEGFRTSLLNIKSYSSANDLNMACSGLLGEIDIPKMISDISSSISTLESKISVVKDKISEYNVLLRRTEILKGRPDNCKINSCSFIKDALDAQSQNPEQRIDELSAELNDLQSKLGSDKNKLLELQDANKTYSDLRALIRSFMGNKPILDKLPVDKSLLDFNGIVQIIASGDPLNHIYELYQYIDYANIFELYKNDSETLRKLEADLDISKAQQEVADQLMDDITDLQKKVANIDSIVVDNQLKIGGLEKELIAVRKSIDVLDKAISTFRTISKYEIEKEELESKLKTVATNIDKISAEVQSINKNQTVLTGVIQELSPLKQTRDNINYSLAKLQEYQQELDEYNKKYSIIELLKKYSSPTKGGIQTIFMQLYMDKTLSLANQLLGLVFDGKLELLPYIINENEFRIPTRSNVTNLVADDVSNCSTSEKSMIAMTMSFALAFHSSPLYNIVRLDEIDGGLDQDNKSMFPIVCRNMVEMLGIEQCFVISHSSESDMSDIDIISLYQDSWRLKGNVIFSI